jgi:hypothetical protein
LAERSLAINNPILQNLGVMGTKGRRMAFSPGIMNRLRETAEGAGAFGGKALLPLTAVLALADVAGELADPNDPVSRNLSEAGGQLSGNVAGGLGGAGLALALGAGSLTGPFAPLAIPAAVAAGSWLGGGGGKALAGGVHDLITGYSPEAEKANRARQEILKNAANNAQAIALQKQTLMPITEQELEMYRQADAARAEQDLRLKNDYNYANMLNQSLLAAQQNAALQQLAISQRA